MPCSNFLGSRRQPTPTLQVDYEHAHTQLTKQYSALLAYLRSQLIHIPHTRALDHILEHAQAVQAVHRFLCSAHRLHPPTETSK